MADPPPLPSRPIVLVGPMGAGKSSVGRLLAGRLLLPFVDTDEEVEREAGRTVAAIFAESGEDAFRKVEAEVTARLVLGDPAVIATGGGAFADSRTRTLILERCTAVWLKARPETLARRLAGSQHRPLLRGGDAEAILRRLGRERKEAYSQAPIHLDTDSISVDEAVERLLEALSQAPSHEPSRRLRGADCPE